MSTLKILPPHWQKALPYLWLIAAVFAAYSNVYDNVFLFDDNLVIQLNTYLRDWSTFGNLFTASTTEGAHIAGGFYRPVQNILYFLIYQLTGPDPLLFHFLNIALHAANACLMFLLGKRLGFNRPTAFLASLLWALHPLHTEVITYMSGTAEPLFTFFCLLGLIVLLPNFLPQRILISIPFFLLALFSKESAVVFPALAIVTLFLVSDKKLEPQTYLRTWPLWLIVGIYIIWRMNASGFDGPQTYNQTNEQHNFYNLRLYADHFSWRLYTSLATLPAYLGLLIWPHGLHMERNFPVFDSLWSLQVWGGIAICLAAGGQIIWGRARRGLALSWGLLWFAAAHFPNTGLIFPMNAQLLEHWMYFPTVGLFLGTGETIVTGLGWVRSRHAKPAAACAALLVALVLALCTFAQNAVWHDAFSFYGNIFKNHDHSARAHNNLALAYMDREDYPAAIAEFEKAIAITDTYAETRYNLALALLHVPNDTTGIPAAIESLNRSVEIDPNFYRAWDTLAVIYYHIGKKAKAAECAKKRDEILAQLQK